LADSRSTATGDRGNPPRAARLFSSAGHQPKPTTDPGAAQAAQKEQRA
jgi:hypothetical protein